MVTREQIYKVICLFFVANFTLAVILIPLHYVQLHKSIDEKLYDYYRFREYLIRRDQSLYVGSNSQVSCKERHMYNGIDILAYRERDRIAFDSRQNFLNSSKTISKGNLYDMVQQMPKGGLLHVHDLTICSADYLLKVSYHEDLWICLDNNDDFKKLKFSKNIPNNHINCDWMLLQNLRQIKGNKIVDKNLKELFLLKPSEDTNAENIRNTIAFISGMVTYKQAYADYHWNALEELRNDGIFYIELRSDLPLLYDLDGVNGTIYDTAYILNNTFSKFKRWFPDFFGAKLIYAPDRNVKDSVIDSYFDQANQLKELYPKFFIGIDLVTHNSEGRTLRDLLPKLLQVKNVFKFYLHAAQTNWIGSVYDEDLYDLLLLENKRIVNSFSLINHPQVLAKVKYQEIPIEVCPISNQMHKLVTDFRNHPLSYLLVNGFNVVIGSDMPALWNARPLTDDIYVTLITMVPYETHFRLLKVLCWNSLYFSAMNDAEKTFALRKWFEQWNTWLNIYDEQLYF